MFPWFKNKKKEITREDYLKRYVKPHKKVSREITEKDLPKVIEESHILYNLCFTPIGIFKGGFAVAHPQIEKRNPLRLFVTANQKIVINPRIINHTQTLIDSEEACLSFPDRKPIIVKRWNKCEVEYQTLTKDGKLSGVIKETLTGRDSKVFQHEQNHLEGRTIFDDIL